MAAIMALVRHASAREQRTMDIVLMDCPVPAATRIYNACRRHVLEKGKPKAHSITAWELPAGKAFTVQTKLVNITVTVTVGVTDANFWRENQ